MYVLSDGVGPGRRQFDNTTAKEVITMGFSLVIQPDGELYRINLNPGTDHLLQMREHLDCALVDVVRLDEGVDMWIDDEGMYNHPVNAGATLLARTYGWIHQPYFGPVLICSVTEDGDSVDFDDLAGLALMMRLSWAMRE